MVALQKFGVKIFSHSRDLKSPADFIPQFHRWIQRNSIPDHLLIDVVDYSHVHQGPGVVLMAHEGFFALDQSDDRPGLLYLRKRPFPGNQEERLTATLNIAIKAAKLLETDAYPEHSAAFDFRHFRIIVNEQLETPERDPSFRTIRQNLIALEERLGQKGRSAIENVSTSGGKLEINWTLNNTLNPDTISGENEGGRR